MIAESIIHLNFVDEIGHGYVRATHGVEPDKDISKKSTNSQSECGGKAKFYWKEEDGEYYLVMLEADTPLRLLSPHIIIYKYISIYKYTYILIF